MRKILFLVIIAFTYSCRSNNYCNGSKEPEDFCIGDEVSIKTFNSKCNCIVEYVNKRCDIYCEDSLGQVVYLENIDPGILEKCNIITIEDE